MSNLTQYQTYYGIHLDHYSETWGGNEYNKMLTKSFPNVNLISTATSSTASEIKFLYPTLYKNVYYLDGVANGHITLYNKSTSTATSVTAYTVSIKKTDDEPGNETTLGSYTNSITTDNSLPTHNYLTLPVFVDITKQVVNEGEKLILSISVTGGDDICLSHANDSSDIDIKIELPYAPQG